MEWFGKNKGQKHDVVVAGHLCLDMFPQFNANLNKNLKEIFVPGKLTQVDTLNLRLGGAVSGTSLDLKQLGLSVGVISLTGRDFLGEEILNLFSRQGISTEGIVRSEQCSSSYSIMIEVPGYDKIALHNSAANDLFDTDCIEWNMVKNARWFHFGYPNLMRRMYQDQGKELAEMMQQVKSYGLATSMDLAPVDPQSEAGTLNWLPILEASLPLVDVFTPSLEEILFMLNKKYYQQLVNQYPDRDLIEVFDYDRLQQLGDQLVGLGCSVTVIKCGKKGAYVRTSNKVRIQNSFPNAPKNWMEKELFIPSFQVSQVKNTTGCGDSFVAALIASLMNNRRIEQCLNNAGAYGALSVQGKQCKPALDRLEKMLSSAWMRNNLTMNQEFWTYDQKLQVYSGIHDKLYRSSNIQM